MIIKSNWIDVQVPQFRGHCDGIASDWIQGLELEFDREGEVLPKKGKIEGVEFR